MCRICHKVRQSLGEVKDLTGEDYPKKAILVGLEEAFEFYLLKL